MNQLNDQELMLYRENTRVITLGEASQEFAAPEILRLRLSNKVIKKPIDIGSLAYRVRGKNANSQESRGTPVLIESFDIKRRELVAILLQSFMCLRETTILAWFQRTVLFVDWLDANGYSEIFANEVQAQSAYKEYTSYLNHRIRNQEITPVSACNYQRGATRLIELLFPERYHYIILPAFKIVSTRGTPVRSDAHIQLYTDVFLSIAQAGTAFVLEQMSYPCVVNVRNCEVVMFPSPSGAISPFRDGAVVFNASERRIATIDEYIQAARSRGRKKIQRSEAKNAVSSAQQGVIRANSNSRHWHRLNIAMLAAKAYAGLFLLITGATPAEFAQFTYLDALEVEKSPLKKELSAVKFRAGGKVTLYNIGKNNGLPLLKDYLKLREWILNGQKSDKLFFSTPGFDTTGNGLAFNELKVSESISKLYRFISGLFIDPSIPVLSAREIRKNKSVVQHSAGIAPSTVAMSQNHTETMNTSTYAEASAEQQDAEFSRFWASVRRAAAIVRDRSENVSGDELSVAAGHCEGFNQPVPSSDPKVFTIEPNCSNQYGCLYCSHYVCHADEVDLHKLMSLQYVINAVRNTAPDEGHAEELYKDLSVRIEFVIDALSERSEAVKNVVEEVRVKVFHNGILTPFWERRLSRYESMGVVF